MDSSGEEHFLQALNGVLDSGIDNESIDLKLIAEYMEDNALFPDDAINNVGYNINPKTSTSFTDHRNSFRQQKNYDNTNHASQVIQFTNDAFNSPSLPDTPPDSSSEPYSPPHCSIITSKSDDTCMNGNLPSVVTNINSDLTHIPSDSFIPVQHHGNQTFNPSYGNLQTNHCCSNEGMSQRSVGNTPSPHSSLSPGHVAMSLSSSFGSMSPGIPPSNPSSATYQAPDSIAQVNTQLLSGATTFQGRVYNSTYQANKKRKFSDSPNGTVTPAVLNATDYVDVLPVRKDLIKKEPGTLRSCNEDSMSIQDMFDLPSNIDGGTSFLDSVQQQKIKFQQFNQFKYMTLMDANLCQLQPLGYMVSADKGFNFSTVDDSFVCQKKNHFQVTANIQVSDVPQFVRTSEGCVKIDKFFLHFHGIKADSPSTFIKVEQSQPDRSKKPFYPVEVDLPADQVTKVTVGRLHFSETTSNNMRKKGKPNPDQRYFMLMVELRAHCSNSQHLIAAMVSEKIIVRASNPGLFDNEGDLTWQKGPGDVVFHSGHVGVNTETPEEALTVHGNIKVTGQVVQPSDIRAKENIQEMDSKQQLKHVQDMKIYKYEYKTDYAEQAGLSEDEREDTGVLAQELREVLPDAVMETGDVILANGDMIEKFLVVNKDRIYMENVGAVKELCKLTDNLENRIDELEKLNNKLKLKRYDSLSTTSNKSCSSSGTVGSRTTKPHRSTKCCSSKQPEQTEEGVCNNRSIQIVIIGLFLIMAFCLVAIVILYILEKIEDTSSPSVLASKGSQHPVTSSPSSHPVTTLLTPNLTKVSVPVPVITGFTTLTTVKSTMTTVRPTTVKVSTTTTPLISTPKPNIMLIPSACVIAGSCEATCCDHRRSDEGNIPAVSTPSPVVVKHDSQPAALPDISEGAPPRRLSPKVEKPIRYRVTQPPILHEPNPNTPDMNGPNVIYYDRRRRKRKATAAVPSSGEDERTLQTRRRNLRRWTHEDEDTENKISQIKINGTGIKDFVIDDSYCKTKCYQGNYTYFIRISRYLPPQDITMYFKTKTFLKITYCPKESSKTVHCTERAPRALDPKHTIGYLHTWPLPVGFEYHVSYVFRVADEGLSSVCQKPASDAGKRYTEYTFEFQREECPKSTR